MTTGSLVVALMVVSTCYSGMRTMTSKQDADFGQSMLDFVAGILTVMFGGVMIAVTFFGAGGGPCSGQ